MWADPKYLEKSGIFTLLYIYNKYNIMENKNIHKIFLASTRFYFQLVTTCQPYSLSAKCRVSTSNKPLNSRVCVNLIFLFVSTQGAYILVFATGTKNNYHAAEGSMIGIQYVLFVLKNQETTLQPTIWRWFPPEALKSVGNNTNYTCHWRIKNTILVFVPINRNLKRILQPTNLMTVFRTFSSSVLQSWMTDANAYLKL